MMQDFGAFLMEAATIFHVGTIFLASACLAAAFAANRGGLWFVGFAAGAIFGPLGLLAVWLRSGRLCWHCWSRIHLKARKCHNCQGDVVDRRKGKADSSGFGKRTGDSKMRLPDDANPDMSPPKT